MVETLKPFCDYVDLNDCSDGYTKQFAELMVSLWTNYPLLWNLLKSHRHLIHVNEGPILFLQTHLAALCNDIKSFVPSTQDIIMCRVKTTGQVVANYEYENSKVEICDCKLLNC